jgi:hypothetical protein
MKNHNYEQITESQSPLFGALNQRSEALATRLESGATALAALAATLSEAEWQMRLPNDGRKSPQRIVAWEDHDEQDIQIAGRPRSS